MGPAPRWHGEREAREEVCPVSVSAAAAPGRRAAPPPHICRRHGAPPPLLQATERGSAEDTMPRDAEGQQALSSTAAALAQCTPAQGSPAHAPAAGGADAVPALLQQLRSPVGWCVKLSALSALRSLSRGSPQVLDQIVSHPTGTGSLLEVLASDCRPARQIAAALLRSLAAAGSAARQQIAAAPNGILVLVRALQLSGCKMPAAHALASLAAHSAQHRAAVFCAGAVPALAACLAGSRTVLQHAAVAALLALCTDSPSNTAKIAAAVHLPTLAHLVQSSEPEAAQQAALLVSQLASASFAVQQRLAAAGGLAAAQAPAAAAPAEPAAAHGAAALLSPRLSRDSEGLRPCTPASRWDLVRGCAGRSSQRAMLAVHNAAGLTHWRVAISHARCPPVRPAAGRQRRMASLQTRPCCGAARQSLRFRQLRLWARAWLTSLPPS